MVSLATKHNDPEAKSGWGERIGYGTVRLGMNAINVILGSFLTIMTCGQNSLNWTALCLA